MKKENFNTITKLILKNAWLGKKVDQLTSLLFVDCKTDEQKELVTDLIGRIKYVDDDELVKDLKSYLRILCEKGINKADVLFTATAMDRDPDSSHIIAYLLKTTLEDEKWIGQKVISDANKIVEEARRRKTIVFVDEFIGSGRTICGRIKTFSKRLFDAGISDFKFEIFAIACMEEARERIKAETGLDVFSNIFLKKGISDYHPPEKAVHLIEEMKGLEKLLSSECGEETLESLGYGQAEALFARKNGNSPNNVFPIFWWPEYINKSDRPTVLVRAMGR